MRDRASSRLQRYLRVAYEGALGEPDQAAAPARRRPGRWAVGPAAASRIAAVLLVLGVCAATVLLLSRFARGSEDVPFAPAAPVATPAVTAPSEEPGSASPSTASAQVVVHVAGAVASPGLVSLPAGTRVAAAIDAAGGASPDADLDALNLAAPVVDGQQVYVPTEGEEPGGGAAGGAGSPGGASGGANDTALVDLNTADATALETLPGIGPALAQRIIDWRTEHGPFTSVEALTDVSGIGPATLARLRDLVTV